MSAVEARTGARTGRLGEVARDTWLYFRHPRVMTQRALHQRSLGAAVAVTLLALLLTALPFGAVPPPTGPSPTTQPSLVRAAEWAGRHRPELVLLLTAILLAVTAVGYALSLLLARRWGGPRRLPGRRLLVGIGYLNCVSLLSAAIPVLPLPLQLADVHLWEHVNAVAVPLSLVVTGWLLVPAVLAVESGADLSRARSITLLSVATGVALLVVSLPVGAAFVLAFAH
ncbi:MAG: hypothetical protein M3010_08115 [Candidatus Dormibacteraeota bacterium]|nr:hypothetical protein [Candidatus Dormibacteraeota bacterium]